MAGVAAVEVVTTSAKFELGDGFGDGFGGEVEFFDDLCFIMFGQTI